MVVVVVVVVMVVVMAWWRRWWASGLLKPSELLANLMDSEVPKVILQVANIWTRDFQERCDNLETCCLPVQWQAKKKDVLTDEKLNKALLQNRNYVKIAPKWSQDWKLCTRSRRSRSRLTMVAYFFGRCVEEMLGHDGTRLRNSGCDLCIEQSVAGDPDYRDP